MISLLMALKKYVDVTNSAGEKIINIRLNLALLKWILFQKAST